jgi:hypothetical protein
MTRKSRGPLEMFWLWVLGRGLAHMLSELTRGPRLDDAVIVVPVLDSMLVNHSQRDIQGTLRPRPISFSPPPSQLPTVTLPKSIKEVIESCLSPKNSPSRTAPTQQTHPQTRKPQNTKKKTHPKSNKLYDSAPSPKSQYSSSNH